MNPTSGFATLRRGLAYSIIFVLTLILGALLVNNIYSFPNLLEKNILAYKFNYFKDHKHEYNTLFFGSSTTYRGIANRSFDQLMQDKGYDITSFNLGMTGMSIGEIDFYITKVLDLKPINLEWIFIDYEDEFVGNIKENATAARNIYWHNFRESLLALGQILESKPPTIEYKIGTIYANFKSLFLHVFRVGQISELWQNLCEDSQLDSTGVDFDLLLQEQGFYALDWAENDERIIKHQQFLDAVDDYYQELVEYQQSRKTLSSSKFFISQFIKDTLDRINQQGIKVVFLLSPTTSDISNIIHLYQQDYVSLIFAFNDPDTFPDLFEVNHRYDHAHLNEQGARILAHHLAETFAQYLETGRDGIYGGTLARN